jgi:predicted HTH domain antitoxin
MTTLHIDLDDEVVVALLRRSNPVPGAAAREMIVLELYRRGSLSGGKAAELLGMSRPDFLRLAGRLGIPQFDMPAEEWEAEVRRSDSL